MKMHHSWALLSPWLLEQSIPPWLPEESLPPSLLVESIPPECDWKLELKSPVMLQPCSVMVVAQKQSLNWKKIGVSMSDQEQE